MENRNIYWLAIDLNEASLLELKHRAVISQGWCDLNATCLLSFLEDRSTFDVVFAALFKRYYAPQDAGSVSRIFWDLLHVKCGDLIVGIEGTTVMGICEVTQDGSTSYRWDNFHGYAQTVSYGVKWFDWSVVSPDFTPIAPAQSVQGIRGLEKDHQLVTEAWDRYQSRLIRQ